MKKKQTKLALLLAFTITIVANMNAHNFGSYKKTYLKADRFLEQGNYNEALRTFLMLDSLDNTNFNVKFKIGVCYLNSSQNKTKAIPYLLEATKNISDTYKKNDSREKAAPKTTYKYLAKAYQLNYEFEKAIAMYLKYKETLGSGRKLTAEVEEVMHGIETCTNGIDLVKTPKNVSIQNLGENVNSQYFDASPVILSDGKTIFFSSRRFAGMGHTKNIKGEYDEDVYMTQLLGEKNWKEAVKVEKNINSLTNDRVINITPDNEQLIISKNDGDDWNLYLSANSGGSWQSPLFWSAGVNGIADESSASYTADGRILYFVSDRDGGYGGKDIYKCLKLPNGKWGPAQNLGPIINTKYDEEGVFVSPDGKAIFFSSKGHKSMGGYDIFSSVIDPENGFLSAPLNLGYPINTTDDDLYYKTSGDGSVAFVSSIRPNGFGEMDIYQVTSNESEQRDITLIVGRIVNNGKEDLSDNLILVIDKNTHETIQELSANNATGKFGIDLPIGSSYEIQYFVKGKKIYSETMETKKGEGYKVIMREIPYGN